MVLLIAGLTTVGFLVPVVAAGGATVWANPNTAGATSTHTAKLVVSGDSDIHDFDYIRVDYSAEESATTVNNVDKADIITFGVDTDGDGQIDKSLKKGDWKVSHGGSGHTLRVRNQDWDGKLEAGDVIIVRFSGVQNPSEDGTYVVDVSLNSQQIERTTFQISGSSSSTATPTATPTPTEASSGSGGNQGGNTGGQSGTGDDSDSGSVVQTDAPTDTPSDAAVQGQDNVDDDDTQSDTKSGQAGATPTEASNPAGADSPDRSSPDGSSSGGSLLPGLGLILALVGAAGAYYYKFR